MKLVETGFEKAYPLIKDMLEDHYREIGLVGSDLGFDLNVDYYLAIEKTPCYAGFMVVTDDGEPMGYISFFLRYHHHHKGSLFASTDCFYISPQFRGKSAFIEMFLQAEEILKQRGVEFIHFSFSAGNDLTKLGEKMGYVLSDLLMLKQLRK